MNLRFLAILIAFFVSLPAAAQEKTPTTEKEKRGYALGANAGRNYKNKGVDVDLEMMVQGIRDGYSGAKLLMSNESIGDTLNAFQQEMNQKLEEAEKTKGENNRKEGDAFLAQNKTKEGVVTLDSGLQYKILEAGTGNKPVESDAVEVHYAGTTIDGMEFDSSYTKGKPVSIQLAKTIPGWREALKLMPVGSKWQLFIPPELAYGTQGRGGVIGPNATLIFVVELLAIQQ
jgi:FKBP-type peptidyl-prolyl cis-trans isomerase FklB